jgi:hypothetical protein
MRAGKSTASSYLREDWGFKSASLAAKLKELHHVATGSLDKDREWLQAIGHSARVVFGENFWVDRLTETLNKEMPDRWAVDDLRYPNEVKSLLQYSVMNGYTTRLIYVDVPLEVQIARGAEIHLMHDISEKMAIELRNNIITDPETGERTTSIVIDGLKVKFDVVDGTHTELWRYHDELEKTIGLREMAKAMFEEYRREFVQEISAYVSGQ